MTRPTQQPMQFVHVAAEDESVDAEYQLRTTAGCYLNISIQDCRAYGGGYSVNRYGGDGADFYCEHVSEHRSLKAAKVAALALVQAA